VQTGRELARLPRLFLPAEAKLQVVATAPQGGHVDFLRAHGRTSSIIACTIIACSFSLRRLAHRQLADIEVRVRIAAEQMDQASFDALADDAARQIVPKIDVRNFGRCPQPVRETNCAPDEASATDAAPISGIQHALVFPLVPEPIGCRHDGAAGGGCRNWLEADATPAGPSTDARR
jgi:hypothetical protein